MGELFDSVASSTMEDPRKMDLLEKKPLINTFGNPV
jgi:hypothetical protein